MSQAPAHGASSARTSSERAFARHPHYAVAHARGYDAETPRAGDGHRGHRRGVIYGTRGRQVLMHDDLDPQVAAALARAHNNWTRDFCAHDPGAAEVRRAARLPRRPGRRSPRRGAPCASWARWR